MQGNNPKDTPSITKEEIHNIVWKKQKTLNRSSSACTIFSMSGTIALGAYAAYSYMATGREDILMGGISLAFMGVSILDATFNRAFLSNAFNKATALLKIPQIKISQSFLIAGSGLSASAFLGGGELINFIQNNDHALHHIVTDNQVRQAFMESASSIKILANAAPFLLASLANVPKVHKFLSHKAFSQPGVIHLYQTMLSMAGNYMIIKYANKINAPELAFFAGAAFVASVPALLHHQHIQFSFYYEDPIEFGMNRKDAYALKIKIAESGLWEYYEGEVQKMRQSRGLAKPSI